MSMSTSISHISGRTENTIPPTTWLQIRQKAVIFQELADSTFGVTVTEKMAVDDMVTQRRADFLIVKDDTLPIATMASHLLVMF